MDNFVDLHTHTAHSREADNFLNIRLEDYARAKKGMPELEVIGVLDHDTMNYLEPMYRARISFGAGDLPLLLPGIEITSAFAHPTRKRKVVQTHILGYFPALIDMDREAIIKVNAVMEPTMRRVLEGKLRKNLETRLEYFFRNSIIAASYDFETLRAKIMERYMQDKAYVESQEPKEGDIINWPLNPSDKMVIDVLVAEGIIGSKEEGKLYVDRVSDEKAGKLARLLEQRLQLTEALARERARRLQGSCHGDYNDDYYKVSTQEAIRSILNAGGIPILAHPMVSLKSFKDGEGAFFGYCRAELVPNGLRGMEALYPGQDQLAPAIIAFCEKNGLYITGGSDDHQDGRNHIGEAGSRCPIHYVRGMLK